MGPSTGSFGSGRRLGSKLEYSITYKIFEGLCEGFDRIWDEGVDDVDWVSLIRQLCLIGRKKRVLKANSLSWISQELSSSAALLK